MSTRSRKLEHVEICLTEKVEGFSSNYFEYVEFVHQAFPSLSFKEINTDTTFLGKKLKAPLIITGMTGGHEQLRKINENLGIVAEQKGIAIGVGSQRSALENRELEETFKVMRRSAKSVPVLANIGASQIARGYGLKEIERAIEMVEADGIAIHFNPAQELFQPEGEPDYGEEIINRIAELKDRISVPIIIKETGNGISYEVASLFDKIGIRHFDVSGKGGTSWVAVEMYRGERRGIKRANSARRFLDWGIPTACSIMEVRWASRTSTIIASGGIRDGIQASKALALGANLAGFALPALKAVSNGTSFLSDLIDKVIFELKSTMFLTGCKDISDLRRTPLVIIGNLRQWMIDRGIDIEKYIKEVRRNV